VHGSPAVVERLARAVDVPLSAPDATGEGIPVEELALAALPAAASEAAARVLLDQAEGALSRALDDLAAAEDAGDVERARSIAEGLARRGEAARPLFEPPLIVLAGPVNAGKSTLFNALVGSERVVVDAAPGTTRDTVRERVRLRAWTVELVDTAGERDAAGATERAGQALARRLLEEADLVLRLVPPDAHAPELRSGWPPEVRIASRDDERSGPTGEREPSGGCSGSIRARDEPAAARELVATVVAQELGLSAEPWRPGEAVPFLAAQRADLGRFLASLRAGEGPAARRSILGRLRGGGPGDPALEDSDPGA